MIDPTRPRPVGINPLATRSERSALVADGLLATMKALFPNAFGPRTSDVVHASLLTLMAAPGATLVQLPTLLTDASFRRRLTSRIDDPVGLGTFWAEWEAMSSGQQAAAIGPVMSRLRQFLLRPGLRAVLDQPEPKAPLSDVFTKRRIVIVSLNKGLLGGQSATLLGSLVVGQLWQLALAQAAVPQERRQPVCVYLDEAQMFLHLDADLGEALEQSRSLRVAWHLAHQYRRQMPARSPGRDRRQHPQQDRFHAGERRRQGVGVRQRPHARGFHAVATLRDLRFAAGRRPPDRLVLRPHAAPDGGDRRSRRRHP
ncbi:MAG: hypothetical protein QM753_05900 [Thermomicrobiales bacterium]